MARYGTPGTPELSAAMEPFVHGHDAILMANHGVVTYGPDLLTAFLRMETTEHFARVALVTNSSESRCCFPEETWKNWPLRAPDTPPAQKRAMLPLPAPSCPTESVTLTRRELEALIDEAVRRDRARR